MNTNIKNFDFSRRQSPNCFIFDYKGENKNGERLCVEISRSTNPHTPNCLPKLWHKNGFTDTELETWWNFSTYVFDKKGNCRGKYNPQTILYTRYQGDERVETRPIIDFKYMGEANRENAFKIFQECERMFLECVPTKTKEVRE